MDIAFLMGKQRGSCNYFLAVETTERRSCKVEHVMKGFFFNLLFHLFTRFLYFRSRFSLNQRYLTKSQKNTLTMSTKVLLLVAQHTTIIFDVLVYIMSLHKNVTIMELFLLKKCYLHFP